MEQQKSFVDILNEKMQEVITSKDAKKTYLPMEAMVMAVMNNAMKGDISAILFIRGLTEKHTDDSPEYEAQQQQLLKNTIDELKDELKHYNVTLCDNVPELELFARQLITLRRIGNITMKEGHKDLQITPQKDGSNKSELSTTNKIFNDLYKQWQKEWKDYRDLLMGYEIQRKISKR